MRWLALAALLAGCAGPAHCVRAELALWKSNDTDSRHPYRATVRCHNPDGHTDVEVIQSRTRIEAAFPGDPGRARLEAGAE